MTRESVWRWENWKGIEIEWKPDVFERAGESEHTALCHIQE
jgi:hypothetical protein